MFFNNSIFCTDACALSMRFRCPVFCDGDVSQLHEIMLKNYFTSLLNELSIKLADIDVEQLAKEWERREPIEEPSMNDYLFFPTSAASTAGTAPMAVQVSSGIPCPVISR